MERLHAAAAAVVVAVADGAVSGQLLLQQLWLYHQA